MRMPFRPELDQPAGVVHGGAIATLIDSVVRGEDAVAEAWVEKRSRSLVFARVEVRTASDVLAATGAVVYRVGPALP